MAEFALGLTKTAVEGTLSRVKSAIEEETKIKVRVHNDLVYITGEFQMMQSFLNATNTAEHAKNKVVQTWVRQLRDLAFDVEDCVELVVNLDTNKSGLWWRLVPPCMAPPLPLDMAVAEIQQLKARVEDVSQRSIRYNLISDDNDHSTTAGTTATTPSSSAFHILSQVWEASGKLRGTGDLKKLITGEVSDLQVISLWGAAADHLGSSSYIIREPYNDPEICREFKIRAWVKLMHPFNPIEFINTLLAQFHINYHQPIIGADLSKKMKSAAAAMENDELMQQVNKQRYLVVLEDLSAVVQWDAIKMYLPDSNNGSRVIVSTQHLKIALMCTGNPYQVSQLTRFADGQSICAFSKKGSVRRSDLGEFNWQIRCRGVISVRLKYGCDFIRDVYWCIAQKCSAFEGVVFSEHSWVDVPNPFDLDAFAYLLFLNFQSSDFEANEIEEVGSMGGQGVIERCRRYLREADCLIVLNGIESTEDWEIIKDTFLSRGGGAIIGSSTVIILTHEESVSRHCVDGQQNRMFDNVQEDKVLNRLIEDSIGIEDFPRTRLFYDIFKEGVYYLDRKSKLVRRENEVSALVEKLVQTQGVISVWGRPGAGKSVLVRSVYYKIFREMRRSKAFSLVSVPSPFNLKDFSWRLLLDFYTSDSGADFFASDSGAKKEAVAVGLMKGEVDPIQACHQRLRERDCLVVIDDLESKDDWDKIRTAFLSEPPTQSSSIRIIVITRKKSVAKYCVGGEKDRLLRVKPFEKDSICSVWSIKKISIVGRMQEIYDLQKHNPGVTSLWGIAGVGKSALASSMRDSSHRLDCYGKKYKKIWVDVPHPFNLTEFSRRLILGFYSGDLEAKETAAVGIMEGQDIIQACCQFLHEYSSQIIIDDLTSTHDWDLIKAAFLMDPTHTNYIIAITNEESVATHCASDKARVCNVKGLNAHDALELFIKIAWGGKRLAPDELKFSKDIVAKCGGLPKVIVTIGEYVAEEIAKMEQSWFDGRILTIISEDVHHDFMGKLEKNSRFHNLKGLFSWMQSYFNACSDSLKPCIFYLSVFPAEHKRIRRKRLLRRWMAEGYSRDTFGGGTAEEKGEKLFDELVKLSIIQTPRSSHTTTSKLNDTMCQVNGFFREYIISRPMEDNLVFALEGRCSLNSQRTGQHLSIRSCWNREKIVFESIDFTRLRSLTVFGKWMPFFISINMRLLRVLDLEDTESGVTDDDLEHIGKLLPRLKFLSLRGCKDITRLPDSLGDLMQLQTLDVKHTKIVTMPRSIIKLVKLQYVRADPIPDDSNDAGLPAQDENDCASTSSEDSSPSSEDDDDGTSQAADVDDTGHVTSTNEPTAAADGDMTTSQRATEAASCHGTVTSQLTTICGDGTIANLPTTPDGGVARQLAAVDGDDTSQLAAAADGDGTWQLATIDGDGVASTSQPTTANDDGKSTSQPAAATTITSQLVAADASGASISQPAEDVDRTSTTRAPKRSGSSDLVSYSCSWLSKMKKKKKTNDGGVKVPAGIGNLTALHTLGVVRVSDASGKAFLKEIKKLTQLRKLRVSGINQKNWQDLRSAISSHDHLESLSVRLDKDEDASSFFSDPDDMFSNLPNTLKSLKLYTGNGQGNVQASLFLIKQLGNLKNLRKINLELTISTQEDIDSLLDLPHHSVFDHLCINPTQDSELVYGRREFGFSLKRFDTRVLKIDCGRYKLAIDFGAQAQGSFEMLVVHCSSTDASLEVSGLDKAHFLREVRLTGSYSEAIKQHLQQEVAKIRKNKRRVLKLELEHEPRSS